MLIKATLPEAKDAAFLASLLWPGQSLEEFVQEMKDFIENADSAIFLVYSEREAIGFAHCELRNDYVEGTNSSPVGYLEGIYVKENYRQQGIARRLVQACENWAKGKGCQEFASDCELNNKDSLGMHLKLGFEEANRIICFKKKI
ncbi:GNAT family N-acetyltransferase [Gracilibacillus oryzae]|uniref:Aminoglycoside N(6')-acetyltransferase type 1 n=1 Tax=Gracilibacillus oryzae TaxID=1672701 RepID=A0A7C8GTC6_9BACI|nr:aminoglycoside 6'-N-acetyltransferase [Gracilibacillus oryzae]KAB8135726.1 GNAT family N-acetyltransferase [Gracilibacillus oryzae]